MDRIACLQKNIVASLSPIVRFKLAMGDLMRHASLADLKRSMAPVLNSKLRKECEEAGLGEEAANIDFFELIDKAVRIRVKPNDPLYDDYFQEVAINLLNRDGGELKKEWIPKAVQMKRNGTLDTLYGFLLRASQNFVKDLNRKIVHLNDRETQMADPTDDDNGSGLDLDRHEVEGPGDQSDLSAAKKLYNGLVDNFKWSKSKSILDVLIRNGIVGFVSSNDNKRARGVQEVADAMGVTVQTVSQYYVPKFRSDLVQSLGKLNDSDLRQRAKRMFGSTLPVANLIHALDDLN